MVTDSGVPLDVDIVAKADGSATATVSDGAGGLAEFVATKDRTAVPGADVPGIQSSLDPCAPGTGRVEVVLTGEDLPPYQAAALTAGQVTWPDDPAAG